jgi:hypothetical protein
MKVKIMQRSVYHKIAEVEVEVPDGMECNDVHEWLLDNEDLYTNEIDEKISKAEYEFGFGLDNDAGLDEKDSESEWRFEVLTEGENYGGHL